MSDMESRVKDMAAHSFGTWNWQKNWQAPLLIDDAEGVYITDRNGKRYIDFSSQLMCSNLGHKNKAIIEAMESITTIDEGRNHPQGKKIFNGKIHQSFGHQYISKVEEGRLNVVHTTAIEDGLYEPEADYTSMPL